jgi:anti-sigma factor RsiW
MSQPTHRERAEAAPHDCETIVRRLWDYVDGRLPHVQREEVEAHLSACALCPPHFAFAQRLRESLGAAAPEVSDDDASRLRARVRRALEDGLRRSLGTGSAEAEE